MKNMFHLRTFLLAVAAMGLLLLSSCQKDSDNDQPDPNHLLTDKNWKLTALTSNPPIDWFGTPVSDVYAQLPACLKDDIVIFRDNGTVLFDEGSGPGAKCDPSDPQTETASWAFSADKTTITITYSQSDVESWKVVSLAGKTMKVEYVVEGDLVNYVLTATYSAP